MIVDGMIMIWCYTAIWSRKTLNCPDLYPTPRMGETGEIFKLQVVFLSDEFSIQRPVEFGHLANDLNRNLVVDVDGLIRLFSSFPLDRLQMGVYYKA